MGIKLKIDFFLNFSYVNVFSLFLNKYVFFRLKFFLKNCFYLKIKVRLCNINWEYLIFVIRKKIYF